MRHHPMSATTHTLEMQQVAELNNRLQRDQAITAGRLGLGQIDCRSGGQLIRLPHTAELIEVVWDGSPDFPDLHGRFGIAGRPGHVVVDLQTPALRQLSRMLGVGQTWGVGPD